MTDTTVAAGADNSEAGSTQTAEGQLPPGEGSTPPAEGQQAQGEGSKTESEPIAFELKLPNGVELDQAAADEFKGIVSDKALTESQRAQKIVDLAVKREAGRIEAHKARVNEWAESVRTDPELGGDKLPETLAIARKAIDLGPPELRDYLNASGMGNHPAMVRWAYTIGKALSEDRFVRGQAPQAAGTRESRLYPTSVPKA